MNRGGNVAITIPVNIYERPRNGFLARFLQFLPWVAGIVARLPCTWREKIMEEEIHINERIIEHPWVFMNLGIGKGRILDVGCCWSSLSIELACLGYEVWGIDIAPYGLRHPNLQFIREDICETTLPGNHFDRILAVSTVEHLGLGHFGDPKGNSMDKKALKQIHRLLKPGGKLLLTVPFGRCTEQNWFKIYNTHSLRELLSGFLVEKKDFYVLSNGNDWISATEQEASIRALDQQGRPTAIALVIASKAACNGGSERKMRANM